MCYYRPLLLISIFDIRANAYYRHLGLTPVRIRRRNLAAAVQRTTIEKEVQNTGNGTLPSKLPFFSLRLTKSESGHAFSLIRQKSTWWLVGKMMILPHFTLLTLSSCRLVIAHLDSGSRYTVWYFIDIEYRHLVSDSLTPLFGSLLGSILGPNIGFKIGFNIGFQYWIQYWIQYYVQYWVQYWVHYWVQ